MDGVGNVRRRKRGGERVASFLFAPPMAFIYNINFALSWEYLSGAAL